MRNRFPTFSLIMMLVFIGAVGSSEAQMKSKMKYLVIGEFIDPGPMMAPPQFAQMLEHSILPSLDMLAKWEADKKIMGGVYVGARKGVFVVEAESNEEVDKMIQSLPFWGLLKWNVSALNTFAARSAQEKTMVEKMKGITK